MPPRPAGRTRVIPIIAFRALSLEHGRYDLVYQQARPRKPVGRFAEYSAEWLGLLADHTVDEGQLIVDVPLAGMNLEAVILVIDTFEQVVGGPAGWTLIETAGESFLRLRAGMPDASDPARDSGIWWSPTGLLRGDDRTRRVHSLQRDLLTAALRTGPPTATSDLVRSLAARQSAASTSAPAE